MVAENPHIPKYIKDAPWYADKKEGEDDDYLSHHRSGKNNTPNNEAKVGAGIKDEFVPITKEVSSVDFKKRKKNRGGCANCGGMDHEKRDCLEGPRSRKSTTNAQGAVGVVGKGKRNEDVDYDGKRDRWYGYDGKEYSEYVEKWKKKASETNADGSSSIHMRQFDSDEEIELKELGLWDETFKNDVLKAEGEKIIRLREDRAVYLENIRDEDVAYDPKSRTMRDEATGYYDDHNRFVRHLTGEAVEIAKAQKFAWENGDKRGVSQDDNLVSNPTLANQKLKEMTAEQKLKSQRLKKSLMDVYGGLNEDEADDGFTNGEGKLVDDDDEDDDIVRSQYDEDVYLGNHTSVWGSYYQDGKWGYRCCKSLEKGSVCK